MEKKQTKQIRISWTNFLLILIFFVILNIVIWIVITPSMLHLHEKPRPVWVGGDIKPPKLIKKVEPVYPEEAKKAGIEAELILGVYADYEGKVITAEVLNIDPSFKAGSKIGLLYKAATDAVKQWEFEPMIINGRPRRVIFTVTVNFE